MAEKKSLTIALMDAPFESARTLTAMRLIDRAVRRGWDVRVFAYEGAVLLPFASQTAHANAVHGLDVEEEGHPLPKDWVAALLRAARDAGGELRWVNCGLCVDERGAGESIDGVGRGSPADFWAMVAESDSTLIVPTR